MMATNRDCPKCGRKMEEGFTIDAGDHSVQNASFWHPGKPDKRWYGLKIDKKQKRKIETFRCTSCHYLESYAP